MKTKTYSLLALAEGLLLASGTFNLLHAQKISKASPPKKRSRTGPPVLQADRKRKT
jgi:hypothetical protein